MKKLLAVHFHVFYSDNLNYYLKYLKNIKVVDFDIYVTMVVENLEIKKKIKTIFPNAVFLVVPNRGFDVGAFIYFLNIIDLNSYKYILKIHTKSFKKKCLNEKKRSTKKIWINNLVKPLIGKRENVLNNFKMFEQNNTLMMIAGIILSKKGHYNYLLTKINTVLQNIRLNSVKKLSFVPGTMFLARSSIFEKLKNYDISYFEESSSNVSDNQMAHVFERIFGVLAEYYGKLQEIDIPCFWRNVFMYKFFANIFKNTIINNQYSEDELLIAKSKYFNNKWYLKQNQDIEEAGVDPVKHYLYNGGKEGRNPSKRFDGNKYLELNPDVANAKMNPLLHYEKHGKKEGRRMKHPHNWKFITLLYNFIFIKLYSFILKLYRNPPFFSVIMPTYNRAFCIKKAINSVLNQAYENFELIIVDDGSNDNTENLIRSEYGNYLKNSKIKYLKIKKSGVSKARNIAVSNARHNWICYVDSDNSIRRNFLQIFALKIMRTKNKIFYARTKLEPMERIVGKNFNYNSLLLSNFIDLGVFVHHKDLVKELGGFDESLKRLVDWDLILRYTKQYTPIFINKTLLDYCNSNKFDRISNTEDLSTAIKMVKQKHKFFNIKTEKNNEILKLSIVIPIYNAFEDLKKLVFSIEESNLSRDVDIVFINDSPSNKEINNYLKEAIKRNPRYYIHTNEKNLGFIKSVNKGVNFAKNNIIAILNSDTQIPNNFEKRVLDCFKSNKNIACASPIATNSLRWHFDNSIDFKILDNIISNTISPEYPLFPSEGFCFIVNRAIVNKIGLFDEIYKYGYCEEDDFVFRAINSSYKPVLIDNLLLYHKRQASFGPDRREKILKRNVKILLKRWQLVRTQLIHDSDPNSIVNRISKIVSNNLKNKE